MASDFAIAQFRFLERLLLVHGHWCYRRISMMVKPCIHLCLTLKDLVFTYSIVSQSNFSSSMFWSNRKEGITEFKK